MTIVVSTNRGNRSDVHNMLVQSRGSDSVLTWEPVPYRKVPLKRRDMFRPVCNPVSEEAFPRAEADDSGPSQRFLGR